MTPNGAALAAEAVSARQSPEAVAADLWRRDEFLSPITEWLPSTKLVSLDIFDTLLFRACGRPEDVFLDLGQRAHAAGILDPALSPGEFAMLRERAQSTAYATLGREPRLEDIYARLPESIGPRTTLMALEETVEADTCFLNPSIYSFVLHCNRSGIPVVLLSDMYLGEARVRALLARAGFDADRHASRVIVSVDRGTYKMTGASYAALLAEFPHVEPGQVLHIGDNPRADVLAARRAGLRAVHYNVIRHDPDATLALEAIAGPGEALSALAALRRLGGSLGADVPLPERAWFRTGAHVVGPFVSALVDWTLDQAVARGVTLIAPLMREGHLLAPFLTRAARRRGLAIQVQALYVSRHSVALAGLTDVRSEFVPRILDTRRQFTINDLFTLIGVAVPADVEPYRGTLTTSAASVQLDTGQTLRAWLLDFLAREDVLGDLGKLVRAERRRLVDYLDAVFAGHAAVATLDIGFFGQIQRSISAALHAERHHARVTHLLGFGHGPILDDVINGIDVRTFAGGYGGDGDLVRTIHRSAPVIEQLLQGPEGTTTGYLSSGGRSVPVRERNPLPSHELALKGLVQDGATTFHDLWLELTAAKPHLRETLLSRRGAWCRLIHRLIAVPSSDEAARLGSLHDDVNFGSAAVLPFCPEDVEATVAATGVDAVLRRGTATMQAVWPHGVITRADPGALLSRHTDNSPRPYVPEVHRLARHLARCGLTRVVGYGTGDVAALFIEAATILGIQVTSLVDSDARRHGQDVAGLAVTSLDAASAAGVHVYAVLSIAHAIPIAETIRRHYQSRPSVPLIFDLVNPTPIKVKHS